VQKYVTEYQNINRDSCIFGQKHYATDADLWLLVVNVQWCLKARARIELREEATEQDARDVIEIMKYR